MSTNDPYLIQIMQTLISGGVGGVGGVTSDICSVFNGLPDTTADTTQKNEVVSVVSHDKIVINDTTDTTSKNEVVSEVVSDKTLEKKNFQDTTPPTPPTPQKNDITWTHEEILSIVTNTLSEPPVVPWTGLGLGATLNSDPSLAVAWLEELVAKGDMKRTATGKYLWIGKPKEPYVIRLSDGAWRFMKADMPTWSRDRLVCIAGNTRSDPRQRQLAKELLERTR